MCWLLLALLSASAAEAPAPSVKTTVSITALLGLVSKEAAQQALDARVAELSACNTDLESGSLTIAVKTDASGKVVLNYPKMTTLRSGTVAACVTAVLDGVRWPRPERAGATYAVLVTFVPDVTPVPTPPPATP